MTNKPNNKPTPPAPPVRVKLWRSDAYLAQTHPPDGESKDWWQRLIKRSEQRRAIS